MKFIFVFTILFLVMLLRYFLMSGVFFVLTKVNSEKVRVIKDISWSVMSTAIFALAGAIFLSTWERGQTLVYMNLHKFPVWYLPVSFFLYLFIHDTYFYWTHRWMHRNFFKQIHFAHHESINPSAWTSFAFHPYEAIIQAVFLPVIALIIPIHVAALILFLILMSLFGVTNHLGKEIYSPVLSKRYSIITATHHDLHHKKMNYNFGLYFSWWDKWMGTEYL
jgi:lathosterol oxidase